MAATLEATTSAAQDLELLERVLLRFALADDPTKLQRAVEAFLVPVLDKANSTSPDVRKKVGEVLTHISLRLKAERSVSLPLLELVQQYAHPSSSPLLRACSLLFCELAFQRHESALPSLQDRLSSLAELLNRLTEWPAAHQTAFLHLSLPSLKHFVVGAPGSSRSSSQVQRIEFRRLEDKREFLLFLTDFLLLPSESVAPQQPAPAQSTGAAPPVVTAPSAPPGLSTNSWKCVIPKNKELCNGASLAQLKENVLQFLITSILERENPEASPVEGSTPQRRSPEGGISEEDVFRLLLIGTCDAHHAVLRRAEDGIKRLRPDYENSQLVSDLYGLYLGSASAATGGGRDLAPEDRRNPASLPLKIAIVGHLSKSNKAVNAFCPLALQVALDCIFGPTSNLRAKQTGMGFIQAMCQRTQEEQMAKIGPLLLQGVLKLLLQETASISSTSDSSSDTQQHQQLRSYAYHAIGRLAKRSSALFSGSTNVVELLLALMTKEDNNGRIAIQEALASLGHSLVSAPPAVLQRLETIVCDAIRGKEPQARLTAVSYANRLFPFRHARARLVCLIGLGDQKIDVRDEAKRGLRPYKLKGAESVPDPAESFPDFQSMVWILREYCSSPSPTSLETGERTPGFPLLNVFSEVLVFLRQCLHFSATAFPSPAAFVDDLMAKEPEDKSTVVAYRELLEQALNSSPSDDEMTAKAALGLFELVTLAPTRFAKLYASRLEWLKHLLFFSKPETSTIIARLLGVIVPELPSDHILALVEELNSNLEKTSTSTSARGNPESLIHGSASALGFVLAQYFKASKRNSSESSIVRALFQSTVKRSFANLCSLLEEKDALLITIGCQSIGAAAMYAPLPLPDTDKESEAMSASSSSSSSDSLGDRNVYSREGVVRQLIKLTKSSDRKVSEKAVVTLGLVCVGCETRPSFFNTLLDALFSMATVRNEELHFSVGEALANIGAGWASTAIQDLLLPPSPPILPSPSSSPTEKMSSPPLNFDMGQRQADMEPVLKRLIGFIFDSQAQARSSAVIWLLNVVKYAGQHPTIQRTLPEIQTIFTNLLGDSNDLVQEVASRGLVEVYEHSGKEVQDNLVHSLVGALTSGVSTAGFKKTEDSELFPKDAIGSGPSGESLSTYKELCSIATDLGQPELMYKFMNLSSHHALWNSKKGAAFAVRNLAFGAASQLDSYLPSLFPKVYRASYDPNSRLAQSMAAILKALSPDTMKTIERYFDPVMKELLESFRSKQWRVREAACLAIVDVLSGKSLEQVEPYLSELWDIAFREMDDVKETVRKAARSAVGAVANLTLRICDPVHTNAADSSKAFPLVLPQILKGINSNVADVRSYAINFVLKLCKIAGNRLQKHVPEIVDVLLESLTSLEPSQLNYLSFHTDKYDISQEQLESARLAMSRMTPMNEALEYCSKSVNEENVKDLVEKLIPLIKHGVGLPTRVGTAKFIISLARTHPQILQPNTSRLLRTFTLCLEDRSPSIRKAYAAAAANLSRLAPEKQVKALVDHLIFLYQKAEENTDARAVVAATLLELAHAAPAKLQVFNKEILPLVFLGTSDPNEDVKNGFKSVWEEVGAGGTVRIYLKEMTEFATNCLRSSSWALKQQGALTIARIAETTGAHFQPHALSVLKLLLENVPGSIWKGKEALFEAIPAVCAAGIQGIEGQQLEPLHSLFTTLLASILKETKKANREYRLRVLKCLCSLLDTYSRFLTHHTVAEVRNAIENFAASTEEVAVQREEGEKESAEALREAMKKREADGLVKGAACVAIAAAFPELNWSPELCQHSLEIYKLLFQVISNSVWGVKVSALSAVSKLLLRQECLWNVGKDTTLTLQMLLPREALNPLPQLLVESFQDTKYSVVRKAAAQVLVDLTRLLLLPQHENTTQAEDSGYRQELLRRIAGDVLPAGLAASQAVLDAHLTNVLTDVKKSCERFSNN